MVQNLKSQAEAQLSRDKQSLNEKKIEHKIDEISLKEILNLNGDFEINKEQKLIGFWNYKLNKNINEGLDKNASLKNILFQNLLKKSKQIVFYLKINQIYTLAIHSQVHFQRVNL